MNGVTFSRYDTSDHLRAEEEIGAYLEAVMEEGGGDPAYVARALGVVARARKLSRLARDVGMSRQGLDKALSGIGNPSFATVAKVAKALGLRITFEPSGLSRFTAQRSSNTISGTALPGRTMTTTVTVKGQVTIPKRVREALHLTPGDGVDFDVNAAGEVVVRKADPSSLSASDRFVDARGKAQVKWRTDELMALLRDAD